VAARSYQNRVADQSLDTTRYLLSLFGCTEFTWNQGCAGTAAVDRGGLHSTDFNLP
jgi:hypothetical protein